MFGYQPHYGWVIAGVLFLCFTLTVGMLQYSYGVFVAPLEEEFGWTRAEVNVSLSFFAMTGLLAPIAGPILDRFGSSRVMMFSYLLLAISFLPRPWMTELWEFYALNILMYAGMPGAIMLPVGKLIGISACRLRVRAGRPPRHPVSRCASWPGGCRGRSCRKAGYAGAGRLSSARHSRQPP